MKKGLLVVGLVAGLLGLGACGSKKADADKDSWSTIEKNKKVVVGLDDTFVPMGFKDDDGKITGFDVDLATAVFKLYDIKVDFQSIDWSMKESELKNGTIDLIWNGYSINDERKEKVAFSDPYMTNDQVLVTPKAENITTFAGMKDKKLGAQEGSSGYDLFTGQPEILKDIVADKTATLYASFNEAFIDLKSGRIDGLLIDKVYADYYLQQKGEMADYNITTGEFDNEDYAVGARKADKTLVTKINEGIKKLQDNGEFAKISEKWFGEDVSIKK